MTDPAHCGQRRAPGGRGRELFHWNGNRNIIFRITICKAWSLTMWRQSCRISAELAGRPKRFCDKKQRSKMRTCLLWGTWVWGLISSITARGSQRPPLPFLAQSYRSTGLATVSSQNLVENEVLCPVQSKMHRSWREPWSEKYTPGQALGRMGSGDCCAGTQLDLQNV